MARNTKPAKLNHEINAVSQELLSALDRTKHWLNGIHPLKQAAIKATVPCRRLRVSLLGLSGYARDGALRWLLRSSSSKVINRLDTRNNVLEIKLAGQLQSNCAPTNPSRPAFDNLSLVVAPSAGCLAGHPVDHVRFTQDRRILILADTFETATDRRDLGWAYRLAGKFDVVWLWRVPSIELDHWSYVEDYREEIGYRTKSRLPATLTLSKEVCPTQISIFANRHATMRVCLGMSSRLATTSSIAEAMERLVTSSESTTANDAKSVEAELKRQDSLNTKSIEQEVARVKAGLKSQCDSVLSQLAKSQATELSPVGMTNAGLNRTLDGLSIDSLEHERKGGEDCYSLTGSGRKVLEKEISTELMRSTRHQVKSSNAKLGEILVRLSNAVSLTSGTAAKMKTAGLSVKQIAQRVPQSVDLGQTDLIRIKHQSIIGILGKTRQKVFMVLMITMLLPKLGLGGLIEIIPSGLENVFAMLGAGFFICCFGGVIAEQKAETMRNQEMAMEKLRTALRRSGTKSIEEIQKETLAYASEQVNKLVEQTNLQTDVCYSKLIDWVRHIRSIERERTQHKLQLAQRKFATAQVEKQTIAKVISRLTDLTGKVGASIDAAIDSGLLTRPNVEIVRAEERLSANAALVTFDSTVASEQARPNGSAPLERRKESRPARDVKPRERLTSKLKERRKKTTKSSAEESLNNE